MNTSDMYTCLRHQPHRRITVTLTVQINRYPDGRVTAKDAAAYVGLSEKTLANLRTKGTGPKFLKVGKVFYFVSDLDEWLQSAVVTATCQT